MSVTTSYLYFFLLIPFLNVLVRNMDKSKYKALLCILLFMYTLLPSIGFKTVFSSIIWFSVIYFIGAYIRLFVNMEALDYKLLGKICIVMLLLSWSSILFMVKVGVHLGKFAPYFFVTDENKILALLLAISAFPISICRYLGRRSSFAIS